MSAPLKPFISNFSRFQKCYIAWNNQGRIPKSWGKKLPSSEPQQSPAFSYSLFSASLICSPLRKIKSDYLCHIKITFASFSNKYDDFATFAPSSTQPYTAQMLATMPSTFNLPLLPLCTI